MSQDVAPWRHDGKQARRVAAGPRGDLVAEGGEVFRPGGGDPEPVALALSGQALVAQAESGVEQPRKVGIRGGEAEMHARRAGDPGKPVGQRAIVEPSGRVVAPKLCRADRLCGRVW
jgi:hypothetical protein